MQGRSLARFGTGAILALAFVLAPRPAAAQCAMMGGGSGHDHSAARAHETRKSPTGHKKLQQGIDRLLADEQGRVMLADALLNDRAFMQDFVRRLATVAEWRDLVARQPGAGAAGASEGRPNPEIRSAVAYACPMHPDVTSAAPADCPKCGMKLVRRGDEPK